MISIITRIIVVVVRTVCNCQFCSRFTAKLSEDYSLARTQTCPNFLGPQNSSLSLCKIRLHKFAGANFASAFRCVAFRSVPKCTTTKQFARIHLFALRARAPMPSRLRQARRHSSALLLKPATTTTATAAATTTTTVPSSLHYTTHTLYCAGPFRSLARLLGHCVLCVRLRVCVCARSLQVASERASGRKAAQKFASAHAHTALLASATPLRSQ